MRIASKNPKPGLTPFAFRCALASDRFDALWHGLAQALPAAA
jgi:hypothetical protein